MTKAPAHVTMAMARAACLAVGARPGRSIAECLAIADAKRKLLAQKVKPDWKDPLGPKKGGTRKVHCIHCGSEYTENEMVYERRFMRSNPLWWCKTPTCDGAGLGFDIYPVEEIEHD